MADLEVLKRRGRIVDAHWEKTTLLIAGIIETDFFGRAKLYFANGVYKEDSLSFVHTLHFCVSKYEFYMNAPLLMRVSIQSLRFLSHPSSDVDIHFDTTLPNPSVRSARVLLY